MDLLLAGFAGVVVGAVLASAIFLYVLERKADRDLVERRLRACTGYLEDLEALERAFASAGQDRLVLEEAWAGVSAFVREYRLTSWLFAPKLRGALDGIVAGLEDADRATRTGGGPSGGRTAQDICENCHRIRRLLRSELAAEERAFRGFRWLPFRSRSSEAKDDAA
jgi:hypothetical protein